jgi:hypothetical protein
MGRGCNPEEKKTKIKEKRNAAVLYICLLRVNLGWECSTNSSPYSSVGWERIAQATS